MDEDGAHGYTICMGCGNVLEDQVQFQKKFVLGFYLIGVSTLLIMSPKSFLIIGAAMKKCRKRRYQIL